MSKGPRPMASYPSSVERHDPEAARSFELHFSDHGGRVIQKDVENDEMLRWYRRRYWDYLIKFSQLSDWHKRILTRTYLDYVDNNTLNAVASKHNDTYLIGCYKGAIANISGFFYIILSHPNVLPEYGDAKSETQWFNSLATCDWRIPFPNIIESIKINRYPPDDWPRDPLRKSLAAQLATFALDFLFFHEMGHLVNRHVDYILRQHGGDLEEFYARDARFESPDFRALELNADYFATQITSSPWFDDQLPHTKGFHNVFSSPGEALGVWTMAIGFLFLLFDPHPTSLGYYKNLSHPHPAVRLANAYLTSMDLAEKTSDKANSRADRAWKRALNSMESICREVQIPTAVWTAMAANDETNEINNIYKEQQFLAKHLQGILPKLSKLGASE